MTCALDARNQVIQSSRPLSGCLLFNLINSGLNWISIPFLFTCESIQRSTKYTWMYHISCGYILPRAVRVNALFRTIRTMSDRYCDLKIIIILLFSLSTLNKFQFLSFSLLCRFVSAQYITLQRIRTTNLSSYGTETRIRLPRPLHMTSEHVDRLHQSARPLK